MNNSKRPQTPKSRNEQWARANMELARRNNTMPRQDRYKRPKAGSKNREW